ncbi:transporter family-2 protein [Lewinella aquimaris]|uniref:Transporter family-2 protein n=1 Tax=Neolewinella aquimaris TaxID=1835722 RepID=A0A840E205_9BACT|nr:DMT family transporter [Neolewinella aquimaris]MBB4077735.1 transporter family-2 protein [Neolewinella aquimaris]
MQQFLLFLMAVVAGAMLAVQAGLNSGIGKAVKSPVYGALISFVTGGIALLVYCLVTRVPLGNLRRAFELPWYYWMGGVLGGFYVFAIIVLAPRLGVALTIGLTVAGQMVFSLVIDHYGMMGIPQQSINWLRVAGITLIIGGVVMLRTN